MDEIEFRRRVDSDPEALDQEVLDAARDNPAYQKILDQTRQLDSELSRVVNSVAVPEGLQDKLLSIPTTADRVTDVTDRPAANGSFFRYYAIAASVLLAIGVTFSLSFNRGPLDTEIAFGGEVLQHLYLEEPEIRAINAGSYNETTTLSVITEVMAGAGMRLVGEDFMQAAPIRFARPCVILPAFQSAHLILETNQGAISVIVINNSPVSVEYSIQDDRFDGVVVPLAEGNMILIGEKDVDLDQYKSLFSENIDFVI